MKTKIRTTFIIAFFTFLFIILYIAFAATILTKEYKFTPEWTVNLSEQVKPNSNKEKIPFILGQSLGYFSDDGTLLLTESFPSKAYISDSYFTTYNTQSKNIIIKSPDGSQKAVINNEGFPFIQENRVYLMQPGGTSYSMYDSFGNEKWICENSIPITAFTSNQTYTVTGYANGQIKLHVNNTGKNVFSFLPGGSDFPVIYGLDISSNGEYIATICGLSPQRFIISKRDGDKTKIVYHQDLSTQIKKRTLIKFSKDNSRIYYNYANGLGIYSFDTKKIFNLPMAENILQIEESNNLLILLTNIDNKFTVKFIEKTNKEVGSFSFDATYSFIKVRDENLYIGKDDSISKISLRRE